ncbi:hypothetical protein A2U01_0107832 [Trifolium medium]|uniref:Uncharacterized protein n=1 Tax=Trifolium medium TaxID=97028 RepID=A0A392VHW6_9FABA|nr:hypothetical protein [Trifolium medium]
MVPRGSSTLLEVASTTSVTSRGVDVVVELKSAEIGVDIEC